MSRRTKQLAATRRTRRAEKPPLPTAEFGFAERQRVVSNPIFYCGGNGPSEPKPPSDQLRCVYGPGALVHDPAAGSSGIGKPLPLPPCRAHRGSRVGPAVMVTSTHGRVLRRAHRHQHDPFLAAYVACSKSSGGENGARVKRRHEKKKTTTTRKGDKVVEVVRGCGIWNGWAAGAKYANAATSCKNACAVVNVHAGDAPAKEEAGAEAPAGPTLDWSWAPVVLSARALERRREQR